jgi:hypothetical protein
MKQNDKELISNQSKQIQHKLRICSCTRTSLNHTDFFLIFTNKIHHIENKSSLCYNCRAGPWQLEILILKNSCMGNFTQVTPTRERHKSSCPKCTLLTQIKFPAKHWLCRARSYLKWISSNNFVVCTVTPWGVTLYYIMLNQNHQNSSWLTGSIGRALELLKRTF